MNRFILLALLSCAFPCFSQAQDIGICIQVLGAAGKSTVQAGRYYAYTVGEPFILTLEGSTREVTQGFHQPDLCVSVSTSDLDLSAWHLEVFPNPTTDVLQIRYDAGQNGQLEATVFDVLGHVVVNKLPLADSGGSLLDCASWQAGVYFLLLRNPVTQATATVRFIRL
ncbi:MAG: T9SS type A sorting domain-containing protein [Saprospiraceae bacterium]